MSYSTSTGDAIFAQKSSARYNDTPISRRLLIAVSGIPGSGRLESSASDP